MKKLRAIRPDFGNGNQWSDPCQTTQTVRSPVCDAADSTSNNIVQQQQLPMSRYPSSSSSSSSPSPCPNAADHFAPMLSTLDMNPKVVLVRTPVNSPGPSPIKKPDSASKMFQGSEEMLRSYVLLEKLDKANFAVERTMKNLKSLDMIQVIDMQNPVLLFCLNYCLYLTGETSSHCCSHGPATKPAYKQSNCRFERTAQQYGRERHRWRE